MEVGGHILTYILIMKSLLIIFHKRFQRRSRVRYLQRRYCYSSELMPLSHGDSTRLLKTELVIAFGSAGARVPSTARRFISYAGLSLFYVQYTIMGLSTRLRILQLTLCVLKSRGFQRAWWWALAKTKAPGCD